MAEKTNENPLVSVVIPVYNGEKTLKECLDSVVNQTYENYEVIVVDNNSTDSTKEIISQYEKAKYVFEGKPGRGAARNAGIDNSHGEIIAMIDCDCVAEENWLEELIMPIIYKKEDVVQGSEINSDDNFWQNKIQKANEGFIERHRMGDYLTSLDSKNFAIKTDLARDLMFDPEAIVFEDFEFYIRLRKVVKIRFLPEVKVKHYHKSSLSSTINMNFDRAQGTIRIWKKYRKDLGGEPMTESISLKNLVIFPFWMALQFIKQPIGDCVYLMVSELSWRFGLLWGFVKWR